MAEYRDTQTVGARKSSTGKIVGIVLLVAVVIVGLLFATGFWSADVKQGALPDVDVSGGALPSVDVDSKAVVVGTKETTVAVPKIETEKETVEVPVVAVKDNGEK